MNSMPTARVVLLFRVFFIWQFPSPSLSSISCVGCILPHYLRALVYDSVRNDCIEQRCVLVCTFRSLLVVTITQ